MSEVIKIKGDRLECTVCGALKDDYVEAHAHVILHHPKTNRYLELTVDKSPHWYYVVYGKPNPTEKPPGVWGTKWRPTIWEVVEWKDGQVRHIPYKLHPMAGKNIGALMDVGTTLYYELVHVVSGVDNVFFRRGRACAVWLTGRLGGRRWCIVTRHELEEWFRGEAKNARVHSGAEGKS